MKKIIITMRENMFKKRKEQYDIIDRNFFHLAKQLKFDLNLLPNSLEYFKGLSLNNYSGFILSGGDDIFQLTKIKTNRDIIEKKILIHCIKNKKPILGVCRGMQVIQTHFGDKLVKVKNHTNTRHNIIFNNKSYNVNSFHNYGTYETQQKLVVLARSKDNVIESIRHKNLPIFGIMWHPEREEKISKLDKDIFESLFLN